MGCCSLLAIQQIVGADPQDRRDLDYSASPDQPNVSKTGCGYQDLLPLMPYADALRSQRLGESGGNDWMFEDPQRVAADTLACALHIDLGSVSKLRETRKVQGRFVYHWKPSDRKASYMIVVSRPYWLSFYAQDSTKVAWVALAAFESSCGNENSVIRLQKPTQ
jgi:hypothetical protein